MNRSAFLTVRFTLLFYLFAGCAVDPEAEILSLKAESRFTSGCIRQIPYEELTNEALLTWVYEEDNLELYINLDIHCLASLTDSVRISGNTVTIFLEDTVSQTSACACIFREVFYLNASGYEEVKLRCYFKPFAEEVYKPVIDQTLMLTPLL